MLTSIRLQNVKAHLDTTVPLGKLTVLVGPNGTGKTTILDAIHQVSLMAGGNKLFDVYKGNHDLHHLRRRAATATSIAVAGVRDGRDFTATLGFGFQTTEAVADDDAPAQYEPELAWSLDGKATPPAPHAFAFDQVRAPDGMDAKCWQGWLKSAACFRLDARVIAAPASSKHRMPRIQFDGRDAAVALKAIKLGYDQVWSGILSTLREVVPNVTALGVEQVAGEEPVPSGSSRLTEPSGEWYRIVFGFKGADQVPAFGASEGTLLTLAIITILHAPSRPNIILLDDVEQGLHPTAQMEMMRQLKVLLARDDMRNVQVIATTHSPFVLDPLDFDEVRVFAAKPDGSAVVKSLSEHPDAPVLRGKLSAGELWTSDQESDWVLGA